MHSPDEQETLLEFSLSPVGQLHLAVVPPRPSGTVKQNASGEQMLLSAEHGLVIPEVKAERGGVWWEEYYIPRH